MAKTCAYTGASHSLCMHWIINKIKRFIPINKAIKWEIICVKFWLHIAIVTTFQPRLFICASDLATYTGSRSSGSHCERSRIRLFYFRRVWCFGRCLMYFSVQRTCLTSGSAASLLSSTNPICWFCNIWNTTFLKLCHMFPIMQPKCI